jgi:hypothetical protein
MSDGVVDLVRAGVVQVFALEQDLRAADLPAQAFGVVDRAGPAHVMGEVLVIGGDECGVTARFVIGRRQLLQWPDQRFGNETAAIAAEVAVGVGIGVEIGDGGDGRYGHDATAVGDRLTI